MNNAFRTRLREALGLPSEIEEEGGAGGAAGSGAGTGTGPGAGDGSGPGAGDGSGNGMEGGDTTPTTPIGHGFPLGWWRAGSYNKDKCPDGKHRDPKNGQCKKK